MTVIKYITCITGDKIRVQYYFETHCVKYQCYEMQLFWWIGVYANCSLCRGYMWNNIISKLFQPSSTSLWNNFISARGNLPEIISQAYCSS